MLGLFAEEAAALPWYQKAWNSISGFFIDNWRGIVTFLGVLILGVIVIKIILWAINKAFKKVKAVNDTARHFLVGLIKAALYIIYVIALLSLLGVPTTSMIAVLSAFALAISLALQDTISNLASGLVLVVTKPFSEGDYVELSNGSAGTVDRIAIFSTRLITPDNKVVVLPNSSVVSSAITNFSQNDTRRVDIPLSVAYGTNVDKLREVGLSIAAAHPGVLQDPAPVVKLDKHGASSLDFILRVWVKKDDYWDVYFDLRESAVRAFEKEGIEIPFSQVDVHVKGSAADSAATVVSAAVAPSAPVAVAPVAPKRRGRPAKPASERKTSSRARTIKK